MPTPKKVLNKLPLKYPRWVDDPSYKSFFKQTFRLTKSPKAFANVKKETFDLEYEKRVRDRFAHDDSAVTRYMQEV